MLDDLPWGIIPSFTHTTGIIAVLAATRESPMYEIRGLWDNKQQARERLDLII
jgi:hypothetical protein